MNKRTLAERFFLLSVCTVLACGPWDPDPAAFDHSIPGFGEAPAVDEFRDIVAQHPAGAPLEDAHVEQLIARLDSLLTPEPEQLSGTEEHRYFRGFRWALRRGQVTADQVATVSAYLDEVKAEHPRSAEMMEKWRRRLALTPGAVAPNIVGTDTEGVEFELTDYRGNVVVLVFSGEWCGPCRAEYPYQNKLMETYKDQNVVVLGVNSDSELETIREAKALGEAPPYRTWWDGHRGPIAMAWDAWKWPSTFILDADGVVRFVDKLQDDMIDAVGELLEEQRARAGTTD